MSSGGTRFLSGAKLVAVVGLWLFGTPGVAHAQRARENAILASEDAFGSVVGNEKVGLYSSGDVRGFSPATAGNVRIEGLYIDRVGELSERIVAGSSIRVGITAQSYPFAAPSGIDDFKLRGGGADSFASLVGISSPSGNNRIDFDAHQQPTSGFGITGGVGYNRRRFTSGASATFVSSGFRGDLRIGAWTVSPFWGRVDTIDRQASPLFVTNLDFVPRGIRTGIYTGPDWLTTRSIDTNYGVILRAGRHDGLSADIGVFRSSRNTPRGFSLLFRNVGRDLLGDRIPLADPSLFSASTSGEMRVKWVSEGTDFRHSGIFSLRIRERKSTFGGSASAALGRAHVNSIVQYSVPHFSFSRPDSEAVRQITPGVGYELAWRRHLRIKADVSSAFYYRRVDAFARSSLAVSDRLFLYNLGAVAAPNSRLSVYARSSLGLEDGGIAPESVVNRREILPAFRSAQTDAGVRVILRRETLSAQTSRAWLGVI